MVNKITHNKNIDTIVPQQYLNLTLVRLIIFKLTNNVSN
jgi:hypothetical protein